MFGLFDFRKRRRERLRSEPFPQAWEAIIRENIRLYDHLLESDRKTLQGHVQVFLAEKQFEEGSGSVLSLLNAQTQFDQARIGLIQAEARRLSDTAALYQALGGGWWNRPAPPTPSTFSPYVPAASPDPAAPPVPKPCSSA